MQRKLGQLRLIVALAIAPAILACGRREREERTGHAPPATMPAPTTAMRVTDVELGNAIGPDKRISGKEHHDFKPGDVIYATVATEGAANNAILTARWTYEDGQTIEETSQTLSPTGPATTEFHISKPGGWPEGKYKVEVLLNGAHAKTEEFKVKK